MVRDGSRTDKDSEGLRLFLSEHGDRLARTAGGLLVGAALAAAAGSPAMARSHGHHSYHSAYHGWSSHSTSTHAGGGHSWFSWRNPFSFWHRSHSAPTADQTIDEAKKALAEQAPTEHLQAGIDARRELLEDATHKLEALRAAIANENGLDEDDQQEAIRNAAQDYNAALSFLKIPVDAAVDEDAVVGGAPGTSTETLKAFHEGY